MNTYKILLVLAISASLILLNYDKTSIDLKP